MERKILNESIVSQFSAHLYREEKSVATQEKYMRDVRAFCLYVDGKPVTKELVVAWKKDVIKKGYAVRSINSMLVSVNSFLDFLEMSDCKAKNIRPQRQIYCAEDKELTKAEYLRLLKASEKMDNCIWCSKLFAQQEFAYQSCVILRWRQSNMERLQ